jgi:hypothetical protein
MPSVWGILSKFRNKPFRTRPFATDSCHDSSIRKAGFSTGVHQRRRNPVKGHDYVSSSVIGLFYPRAPFAILSGIISVIVYSLKGFFRRSLTHVFQKGNKRVLPATANTDAASTIIFIFRNIFIRALSFHRRPDSILRSFGHSMLKTSGSGDLSIQTTATSGKTATEIPAHDYCDLSANAEAFLITVFSFVWDFFYNFQTSKLFANDIHEVPHANSF